MSQNPVNSPSSGKSGLIPAARDMIRDWRAGFTGRWLLVDVRAQRLILLQGTKEIAVWPVSTAAVGLDNRQGSAGTPGGLHRIDRKIGEGADPGMIFESRQPTGVLWRPTERARSPEGDLILTRILTLDGLEEGANRGPGVDSKDRFIYIHGTNHEDAIGSPESGGCVRLTNRDVLELFGQVEEGDPVVIL